MPWWLYDTLLIFTVTVNGLLVVERIASRLRLLYRRRHSSRNGRR